MKPIQTLFKQAARLANEWRDTLSYTALVTLMGVTHLEKKDALLIPLFLAASIREIGRAIAWGSASRQVAGMPQFVDPAKNVAAAGIVYVLFAACAMVVPSFRPLDFCLGATVLAFVGNPYYEQLILRGATISDIPDLYFDKETGMWDWPRKDKGNGPTQTQKLKDGFSAFGRKLSTVPRPALGKAFSTLRAVAFALS
jgi:hypothetical protein